MESDYSFSHFRVVLIDQILDWVDSNADVHIEFDDGREYVGTFVTLWNIDSLLRKFERSGEDAFGIYFWCSDMIVTRRLTKTTIIRTVTNMYRYEPSFPALSQITTDLDRYLEESTVTGTSAPDLEPATRHGFPRIDDVDLRGLPLALQSAECCLGELLRGLPIPGTTGIPVSVNPAVRSQLQTSPLSTLSPNISLHPRFDHIVPIRSVLDDEFDLWFEATFWNEEIAGDSGFGFIVSPPWEQPRCITIDEFILQCNYSG